MFEKGYSTTEKATGFGLAVVQEIADAHGWEVHVTGCDDGGARFEMTQVDITAEYTLYIFTKPFVLAAEDFKGGLIHDGPSSMPPEEIILLDHRVPI